MSSNAILRISENRHDAEAVQIYAAEVSFENSEGSFWGIDLYNDDSVIAHLVGGSQKRDIECGGFEEFP